MKTPQDRCRCLSNGIFRFFYYVIPCIVQIVVVTHFYSAIDYLILPLAVIETVMMLLIGSKCTSPAQRYHRKETECDCLSFSTTWNGVNLFGAAALWNLVGLFCSTIMHNDSDLFTNIVAYSLFLPWALFGVGFGIAYVMMSSEENAILIRCYKMLSFWSCILFCLVPTAIEIYLAFILKVQPISLVILICGSILTILGGYGGFHLTWQIRTLPTDQIWCLSFLDLRQMVSGAYLTYSLPAWIFANTIVGWINYATIPWYVNLIMYAPVLIYGLMVPVALVVIWVIHGSSPERTPLINN